LPSVYTTPLECYRLPVVILRSLASIYRYWRVCRGRSVDLGPFGSTNEPGFQKILNRVSASGLTIPLRNLIRCFPEARFRIARRKSHYAIFLHSTLPPKFYRSPFATNKSVSSRCSEQI
jgi:lantibiotic modifying enzyme